jgi:adenylosuccinate lyase
MAADTAATQWFERTLDDSAPRRLYIPQAFLAADACLKLALNLASGLVVNREVIGRAVTEYLPYMATENLIMACVARGGDRQEAHEVIRTHSHAVTAGIKAGTATSRELIARLQADPMFAGIDVAKEMDPLRYVGRAPEQVDEFVAEEVRPVRERYAGALGQKGEVDR